MGETNETTGIFPAMKEGWSESIAGPARGVPDSDGTVTGEGARQKIGGLCRARGDGPGRWRWS